MAKKFRKSEKLGDIVGARRPVWGSVFVFLCAIFGVSLMSYRPGQEIYFSEFFNSFFPSTAEIGRNLCGKVGATVCVSLIVTFGVAVWMFPLYFAWLAISAFTRRAVLATKTVWAAMVLSIFLLPILASAFQFKATGGLLASAFFPCGWGGGIGSYIFNTFLLESVDVFGSALIAGALYLICLIIIFVDSPAEAAREISGVVKKSPPLFVRLTKIIFRILWIPIKFIFSILMGKYAKRRVSGGENDTVEVETEDELLSPDGVQKIKISTPQEVKEAEPSKQTDNQAESVEVAKPLKVDEDMFDSRYSKEIDFSDGVRFGVLRDDADAADSLEKSEEDKPAESVLKAILQPESNETKEQASDKAEVPVEKTAAEDEAARKREKFANLLEQRRRRDSRQGDGTFTVIKPENDRVADVHIEKKRGDYIFPSVDLLSVPVSSNGEDDEDYDARMAEIVGTIDDFGVKVFPASAESGPVITRYELTLASGIRINKVAALDDEIAMKLKAQSVRIIAPIPGKGTIGVEIPNRKRRNVVMRDIIESVAWSEKKAAIPIVLGKDVTGKPIVLDLAKMPHALIAGSTGSGKSVCINAIITSLLYYATPDDLRFILVDPKQVELQVYNTLPHMLIPVVSDAKKVPAALNWLCTEMERRYAIFSRAKVRNISGFNAKLLKDKKEAKAAEEMEGEMTPEERVAAQEALEATSEAASNGADEFVMPTEKLPYIVCIVDELADIMIMVGKEVDALIARLTAKARAAGIHLILATQRPSVDVITGVIKANLPFRIAFKTVSATDSRTILDCKGAEMLIGNGDLLFGVAGASPIRAQGAFISDDEINSIAEALKVNGEPEYVEEVEQHIANYGKEDDGEGGGDGGEYEDPMVAKAIEVIRANKKASTSFLQRKLGIGYGRAARIIDILEEDGAIGPEQGPGVPRDIYL